MADLPKEEQDFQEVFNSFDKNSDGSICTKELGAALKQIGGNPSDADVEEMMKRVDADGSGTLEFSEFVTVMKNATAKLKAQEIFQKMDKDGNGFLTPEELREALKGKPRVDDAKIDKMIAQLDVNGDGKVSYKEYLAMMIADIRNQ